MLFLIDGPIHTGKSTIVKILQQDYKAIPLKIDTTDSMSEDLYSKINHNYITPQEFKARQDNDEYFIYKTYFGSLKKNMVYYGFKNDELKPEQNYFAIVTPVDAINFIEHYKDVTPICYIKMNVKTERREFPNGDLYKNRKNIFNLNLQYRDEWYKYDPRPIYTLAKDRPVPGNEIVKLPKYLQSEVVDILNFEIGYAKSQNIEGFLPHLNVLDIEKIYNEFKNDFIFRQGEDSKFDREIIDELARENPNVKVINLLFNDFANDQIYKETDYAKYYNASIGYVLVSLKKREFKLHSYQPYAKWIHVCDVKQLDENAFRDLFHQKTYDSIIKAIKEETPKFTNNPIPEYNISFKRAESSEESTISQPRITDEELDRAVEDFLAGLRGNSETPTEPVNDVNNIDFSVYFE